MCGHCAWCSWVQPGLHALIWDSLECQGLLTRHADSHNNPSACSILTAVAAASPASRYVLCLDDDVVLHPGALPTLVAALLTDPTLLMATGGRRPPPPFRHPFIHPVTAAFLPGPASLPGSELLCAAPPPPPRPIAPSVRW